MLGAVLLGWSSLRIAMWGAVPEEPARAHRYGAPTTPARLVSVLPAVGPLVLRRSHDAPRAVARPDRGLPLGLDSRAIALPVPMVFSPAEALSPPSTDARAQTGAIAPSVRRMVAPGGKGRWSADGWLMLRSDGAAPVVAGPPSYGRSQAGAVLRYDLAPTNRARPRLYLRGSAALAGARERAIAAGFSLRPLREVPIRIAAETRVTESAFGTSLRPAVHAVTELPPIDLPFALRGEAYLQAGYVAGSGATAFVDGQVRVERPIMRIGDSEIGAGAQASGGAQEGAARVDVGPALSATFRIGDLRARLAADYRFRIAGGAVPPSGPALTLSAGF